MEAMWLEDLYILDKGSPYASKERDPSQAQARSGSVQMAGEGGVDQIWKAYQPCQLPACLGLQSPRLLVLL